MVDHFSGGTPDGLEATRRIRGLGVHHALRIVAMTANATEADRQMCFDAGMNDYISKPVRIEELMRALQESFTAVKEQ